MEIINAVIENTNSPEVQAILAKLDPKEDVLFTNESKDRSSIEVEYIEPINNIKVIGCIPEDIINTIKEKYGDDASIDIYDYVVTYDNGIYGLAVDIEIEQVEGEKPVKEKKVPFPLLIVLGIATGLLTIILIILKLLFAKKKNK